MTDPPELRALPGVPDKQRPVRRCGNCRYFQPLANPIPYQVEGTCRRIPPTNIPGDDGDNTGYFPEVCKEDWCGAHKGKRTNIRISRFPSEVPDNTTAKVGDDATED